jgi:hypothetical protein
MWLSIALPLGLGAVAFLVKQTYPLFLPKFYESGRDACASCCRRQLHG